jgi:DNA mismatch repair protein MutL
LTVTVHEPLPGTVAPESVTLAPLLAAATMPPGQVVAPLADAVLTRPAGYVSVKAAPAAVGAADLERVLFEILEIAEGELRGVSLDDLRRNICASIACRAAIKINMRLDFAKMESV